MTTPTRQIRDVPLGRHVTTRRGDYVVSVTRIPLSDVVFTAAYPADVEGTVVSFKPAVELPGDCPDQVADLLPA
ncbi:hypothetical protein ABZ215_24870 [Amycolatopsis sp. NPDC006131]|uniref:hypothetical protein n=1 Tax=Amycolatopsis sp. NPDC006131 TaxID=3156731 RepID=UPI0033BAB0FF